MTAANTFLRDLLQLTASLHTSADAALYEESAANPTSTAAAAAAASAPVRHVLYFTSDWTASADARLQPQLQLAAADAHVVVLRQHLVDEPSLPTNSFAAHITERAVPKDVFYELCKQFDVTALPSCVVVDVSNEPDFDVHVADSVCSAPVTELFIRCAAIHSLTSVTAVQTDESALAAMRDSASQHFESGELLAAAQGFVRVLLETPACSKANFNLAVILQMAGVTYFAVHFMLQVVAADDSDSVAHTVLRSVYYPEEPEAVVSGYEVIIAAAPHHVRAVHSLATLRGHATTAAPAYVKEVFDELAETFEEKLVTHLEYRVPWQLVDALKSVERAVFADRVAGDAADAAPVSWTVADVGCGTGLCGRLLRPFVAHIVGVDISPLMVEKTRAAGSYDELHTDDIGPFLSKREDASLDLVISADVWIYVGALEEIFALCARKLKPRGWLAFSTELLAPADASGAESAADSDASFKLAASGRFQHSEAYIAALAASSGFCIALERDVSVRKESGSDIAGRIYLLQLLP